VSTSLKGPAEDIFTTPPALLPSQPSLDAYRRLFADSPMLAYIRNSAIVSGLAVLANLLFCSLAAYPLARMRFAGRGLVLALVVSTILIPFQVVMIPLYLLMVQLGLRNTILGIGLPYMGSAFGIFLLRQAFKQVPRELEEAARVEGAGRLAILMKVYVPLARPTYLAYGLVSVSYHWNNFLWPVVITNSTDTRPLTVGLSIFGAPESGVNFPVISAGTLLAVSPLLIAFLLFQRQFVQSFMRAGIR